MMRMMDCCTDGTDGMDDDATVNTDVDVVSFRVSHQHPRLSIPTSTSTSHALKSKSAVTHARQETSSPHDTEYEFVLDFLTGLKPFAIRLKGSNMSDPFHIPPPIPTPSSSRSALAPDTTPRAKVPSSATRRAACTHLTMERLYGDFTCNVCSRYSTFGWVYCCTQDIVPECQASSGAVSEMSNPPHQQVNGSGDRLNGGTHLSIPSPAVSEHAHEHARPRGEGTLMPTPQLSPWIEEAIKDGHYTPEQIVKLRAQKQHVVDTAKAAIHQFEQSQTKYPNSPSQTSTTLQPVDTNPHLPLPMISIVQEPFATSPPTTKVALVQQAKNRLFPFCKFCACHLCRPTHRDRAWQCFNDIFETEHEIPFVHYDDRNRPLASRSIMSTIGLHLPPLPQRPSLRSSDSRALYLRNEAGQVSFNKNGGSNRKSADPTGLSTDIADMNIETESRGFRESMKRAFKSMLITRQPSSRSHRKRKGRDGTDTTEEDAVEFDMGLWKELNDELLKEASGIPLPEKESMERLSKEVGEMGMGGVAVTEEAASLGTADVIMSV